LELRLVRQIFSGEGRCTFIHSRRPADEYRKTIAKDAALERRFQPVAIDEPTVEATISILRGLKSRYEVHHGVEISDAAIVTGN
jgi:ATP-dependent Clp protease ATP-binding subunit ClpA